MACIFSISLLSLGNDSQKPIDFSSSELKFIPEEFLVGKLVGDGIFFDRWNRFRKGFHLDLNGELVDGSLHLIEDLTYDDGIQLQRTYVFEKIDEHHYEVTANGIVGPAKIEAYGNVLRWKYTLRQQIANREWDLKFDDWMYLTKGGVVINRAYASKFGLRIGEVFMSVRKV